MPLQDFSHTQPSHPRREDTRPVKVIPPSNKKKHVKPHKTPFLRSIHWGWVLTFALLLMVGATLGASTGFSSGLNSAQAVQAGRANQHLAEQYTLASQDLQAGQLELARQRFEYILEQDPNYPGVTEELAQVMQILYATATPTQLPPTITPTPTLDPRPVQDLFNQAKSLVAAQDWNGALDTLMALRKSDPAYQAARVDGLIYISLRQRGVSKILNESNLEGGIYDLALAERFGALDYEADVAREWARLYIVGLSFWEVDPAQAVYYFSQVASAAPGLRDASGYTSMERYREALIQYGNLLGSKEDWCGAQQQYELALKIRGDSNLQETAKVAAERCVGATPTPKEKTATPSVNPTATLQPTQATPTPTLPGQVPTPTQVVPPTTQPPPPTTEPPPLPSNTPEPPQETPTQPSPPGTPATTPYPAAAISQLAKLGLFSNWLALLEALK